MLVLGLVLGLLVMIMFLAGGLLLIVISEIVWVFTW